MRHFLKLAICCLGLLLPSQAWAYAGTILAQISEDVDYLSCTGTCNTNTASGFYRAGWSRGYINTNSDVTDPPPNYFLSQIFANQTTIWTHFQILSNTGSSNQTTNNQQLLCAIASDGNPGVCIRGTGSNGQVRIESRNTSGTFATLKTCNLSTFPGTGIEQVDFKLTYAVSGEATIYLNSVSVCTFSGDTTTNSRTAVNQVRFGGGLFGNSQWSEIIIGTDDTRALGFFDQYTTGDGTSVAWTGSNICTVIWNNNTENDGIFASSASSNQVQQCTMNNTLPNGTYNVVATSQSARVLRGATGPQHFQLSTHIGGSDFFSVDQNPTTSFSNFQYIQATNPSTGIAWTTSDLTSTYNTGLKTTP